MDFIMFPRSNDPLLVFLVPLFKGGFFFFSKGKTSAVKWRFGFLSTLSVPALYVIIGLNGNGRKSQSFTLNVSSKEFV
ncbi:hypothetical protein HOY80DRAFT_89312 [Tuber brumale]|nr:hypothetical protein HOY80DRAFT_89312 [Tuber brumale]